MFYIDKSIVIFFGMVIGLISIYLGYRLFLKGIEGSTTFEGEILKVKLTFRNASPGLFFALFGAFIIITGIYKKEIHSLKIYENGIISKELYSDKGIKTNELIDYTPVLFNIAVNLKAKGNIQDSKTIYQFILLMDNSYHLAHNNLALIYLEENDTANALFQSKEALKFGIDSEFIEKYYNTMSLIYFKIKDYENAKYFINKALVIDSENISYKSLLKNINDLTDNK